MIWLILVVILWIWMAKVSFFHLCKINDPKNVADLVPFVVISIVVAPLGALGGLFDWFQSISLKRKFWETKKEDDTVEKKVVGIVPQKIILTKEEIVSLIQENITEYFKLKKEEEENKVYKKKADEVIKNMEGIIEK